ncbi:PQQ-binding-like beta-propeller repeat protein [Streptomyces sp. NPDC006711]|uniref:outer membrane protein assembly factor BamB family protein n=1 Tax=unclassified Streptomyces TaxID=2593676 RepID=UPI00368F096F
MPAAPPAAPAQPPQPPSASPQPGYGYPGTPPPGPGYGYPQTPPAPGYGYPTVPTGPGAQDNPYAATQQGGYGYPGQPQYPGAPMAPGGGGGKNPFKGKPLMIAAAAVAGLLVIGGGVYLATSGGGDDKKPVADKSHSAAPSGAPTVDQGDGKGDGRTGSDDINSGAKAGDARAWLHENETPLPQNGATQYGPWIVGDTVVKAMYKEIVGYAVADGKQKWSVALDTPLCGAPPSPTADGKTVFGVQDSNTENAKCNQLQFVDLAAGKAGWKSQVPAEGLFDSMIGFQMSITGNTVAVARDMGGASAFSLTDGKKLFGTPKTGHCSAAAFAGGPKLIAVSQCMDPGADLDAPESDLLQELDPTTGKPKWGFQYDKGWAVSRVYSMNPLVVYATNKDKKAWNISTFTAEGKLQSAVKSQASLTANCPGLSLDRQLQGCWGTVVDGNTLYLPTKSADSGELGVGRTNEIVAIDLATGAEKWHAAAPKGRVMDPLAVENGKLSVYVEPGVDGAAAVATLPLTGGAPQITLQSPSTAAGTERSFFDPVGAWAGGRFFLMNSRVSSHKDGSKDNSILSFGK